VRPSASAAGEAMRKRAAAAPAALEEMELRARGGTRGEGGGEGRDQFRTFDEGDAGSRRAPRRARRGQAAIAHYPRRPARAVLAPGPETAEKRSRDRRPRRRRDGRARAKRPSRGRVRFGAARRRAGALATGETRVARAPRRASRGRAFRGGAAPSPIKKNRRNRALRRALTRTSAPWRRPWRPSPARWRGRWSGQRWRTWRRVGFERWKRVCVRQCPGEGGSTWRHEKNSWVGGDFLRARATASQSASRNPIRRVGQSRKKRGA